MAIDLEAHKRYVAWMRLTHNGRRSPEEMSRRDRREFSLLGIRTMAPIPDQTIDPVEAKRLYDEACSELG